MTKLEVLIFIIVLVLLAGCSNVSIEAPVDTSNDSPAKEIKIDEPIETVLTEDLSGYFSGFDGCFVMFDKSKREYHSNIEG